MTERDFELEAEWSERLRLDERGGPARRLSKERALAMVEQALDEVLPAAAEPSSAPAHARKAGSWGWVASAAVALLALVGSAFAALRYFEPDAPAPSVASQEPRPRATSPAAAPTAVVQPETQVVEPEASAAAPAAKSARTYAQHDEPEDLLQAANRLRAQGRFGAAAQVYALVYERHPGSTAAYAAEVARATIELEHRGNARLARTLFVRALQRHPGGALDIEVRQGLLLALRDLGDAQAERAALADLIATHPGSPAAERARARLRELGAHRP